MINYMMQVPVFCSIHSNQVYPRYHSNQTFPVTTATRIFPRYRGNQISPPPVTIATDSIGSCLAILFSNTTRREPPSWDSNANSRLCPSELDGFESVHVHQ